MKRESGHHASSGWSQTSWTGHHASSGWWDSDASGDWWDWPGKRAVQTNSNASGAWAEDTLEEQNTNNASGGWREEHYQRLKRLGGNKASVANVGEADHCTNASLKL